MKSLSVIMSTLALFLGVTIFLGGVQGLPRNRNRSYVVSRWFLMTGYSETPYTACGGSGTVQNVEVVPCDSDTTCELKTGENALFNITFVAKDDSATLKAVVHGIVAGLPMPFHFPQENACEKSNVNCPIKAGETYNYSVQLPVLKSYPKIKVTVKWELKNANNQDVVCVEVPAKLT